MALERARYVWDATALVPSEKDGRGQRRVRNHVKESRRSVGGRETLERRAR